MVFYLQTRGSSSLGRLIAQNDIDSAILRRMPKRFHVPLPDYQARMEILNIFLNPVPADLDISLLASKTRGLSGSDLKELCRNAVMQPVREFVRSQASGGDSDHDIHPDPDFTSQSELNLEDLSDRLRPVRFEDFDIGGLNLGIETPVVFETGSGEWVGDDDGDGGVPGGLD